MDRKSGFKRAFLSLIVILVPMILHTPSITASTGFLNDENEISGRSYADWQQAFLLNIRKMQERQELQRLEEEENAEATKSGIQTTTSELSVESTSVTADSSEISNWLTETQALSPLGLVESYKDDPSLVDQAFTYDQAIAGISMINQGNVSGATQIFDFYYSQWDGTGFWTAYNTQTVDGAKVEWLKHMGPNAWIALFSLHYHEATQDSQGLELATDIGNWIKSLPHKDGGIAMGDSDIWANIYSTENNLSAYSVFKILSTKAASRKDRKAFSNQMKGQESWFLNQAYDSTTGLFKRGQNDSTNALDTNSWALLVFGPTDLQDKFGIDIDAFVSNIEQTFSVQDNGSFGGDVLTAKGFDFSDAVNTLTIGRSGIKWVEGTNQMISVYQMLGYHYSLTDVTKSNFYQARADYFTSKNVDNSISLNGTLSYFYTDSPGYQVFLGQSILAHC